MSPCPDGLSVALCSEPLTGDWPVGSRPSQSPSPASPAAAAAAGTEPTGRWPHASFTNHHGTGGWRAALHHTAAAALTALTRLSRGAGASRSSRRARRPLRLLARIVIWPAACGRSATSAADRLSWRRARCSCGGGRTVMECECRANGDRRRRAADGVVRGFLTVTASRPVTVPGARQVNTDRLAPPNGTEHGPTRPQSTDRHGHRARTDTGTEHRSGRERGSRSDALRRELGIRLAAGAWPVLRRAHQPCRRSDASQALVEV